MPLLSADAVLSTPRVGGTGRGGAREEDGTKCVAASQTVKLRLGAFHVRIRCLRDLSRNRPIASYVNVQKRMRVRRMEINRFTSRYLQCRPMPVFANVD